MFSLKGIKLGVATASAQIEGGDVGSNWNAYSKMGKIYDKSDIKKADDHWVRFKEDIDILDELGIKEYRMSIEWARIEPKHKMFNESAIKRYREEIKMMKDRGVNVLVTLHHFSHPTWFDDMGGFLKEENVSVFLDFAKYVVKNLGDLVSDWCTINEPNVFAVNCYFLGEWLNEEKSFIKTMKVLNVMANCHIGAYKMIHKVHKELGFNKPSVTFAHHIRIFTRTKDNFIDNKVTKMVDFLFNRGIFEAFALGKFKFPFKNLGKFPKGQYIDKIGINYYTRGMISGVKEYTKENVYKNDLGWEIYSEGIGMACKMLYDILPLEIMITENGTCDNTDSFRCRYIYDHLKELVSTNLPITHYYHWCFVDNFEWKEGELPRFGIVHNDYDTQKRTIKKSGYMFSELIKSGEFTKEIFDKYVEGSNYHKGESNILTGLLPEEVLKNKR